MDPAHELRDSESHEAPEALMYHGTGGLPVCSVQKNSDVSGLQINSSGSRSFSES